MAKKVTVLVNGAALDRQGLAPKRDPRGLQSGRDQRGLQSGRAIDDDKFRLLQTARTPIAAGTAMFVAFLSSRVLMTVPSRISRPE